MDTGLVRVPVIRKKMRLNNRALQAAMGEILKILADLDRRLAALEPKGQLDSTPPEVRNELESVAVDGEGES